MNNLVYGAIGFLLGGMLGGALVGHIIAKDCRKQLDEMEERTKLLLDENEKLKSDKIKKREEKLEKEEKKLDKNLESLRKSYARAVEDDEEEEEFEILATPIVNPNSEAANEKPIRVITEQRFMEDINYRDSESMTYYQGDGTLVDSVNDIVTDEATIIGEEAMEIIDDTKNDFIYVLNEDLDKLYEISIEHNAEYIRDVLGVS